MLLVLTTSTEPAINKLTSMLIMTPDTVVAFFAYVKNSINETKFPSFLAFGFRYNLNSNHGFVISATRNYSMLSTLVNI